GMSNPRFFFMEGVMGEATIVRKIMAAIKEAYPRSYCRKLSDRHTRGLPDILAIVPTSLAFPQACLTVFVETKAPGGRVSEIQKVELARIKLAGATAIVARDVATVMGLLQKMGAIA